MARLRALALFSGSLLIRMCGVATNKAHSSLFDIHSILLRVKGADIRYEEIIMSDMVQVLVRLRPDVVDALKLCKERTRMSQSGIIENALREYLEKRGYEVQSVE